MNLNSNNNNEMNLSKLMINILCAYLKGLNDNFIKYISNQIMNNFILYKQKMLTKKLNTIFIIYTKQELLSMQKKLLKWRKNISSYNANLENNQKDNYFHLNLNVGPIMNNSSGVPIIINNNNSSNITNSHLNNSNINNNLYNENEYNQNNNDIIRNYKHKKKEYRNNYSTINNSISNYSTIQKGKQRSYSSGATKRSKNFIPNTQTEKSIIYQMKKNRYRSEKIVNKFIKRQEKYIKNNCQKKQKILKESEEENKLIYTFEPKVNDSLRKLYRKDKLSASKRLYNDSIIRKNKKIEKQISLNRNNKLLPGKTMNQNKCLELYEEAKMKKEKHEELIKKIERECGYTYQPKITHKKIAKNDRNSKIENLIDNKNKSFSKISENKKINNQKMKKNNSCKRVITHEKKDKTANESINENISESKENGLKKKDE